MQTYGVREIQSMLGLSRGVIARLVEAGFVTPGRGPHNGLRFTFQDVVLLRTAYSLRAAQIPPRKILRSLRRLREALPGEMPLTGLRISAVGSEVAVHEGTTRRHVDSGQLLFDFEVQAASASVSLFAGVAPPAPDRTSESWFERGAQIETRNKAEAEACYRRAIALEPTRADAYLNLGVLLGDSGRGALAISLYREGLHHCPGEALLHYNLAVALEDVDRIVPALAGYEACLALEPGFADAHYNAARLHEQLGHASQAIRHYNEYRRLQRRP